MVSRPRIIAIDLDGPILDGRERHYACYRAIVEPAGYAPLPRDQYWQTKRERIDRRRLLAASGADSIYDQFLSTWLATIESDAMLALDVVQPTAPATLAAWRDEGHAVHLVTARRDEVALRAQLTRLGLTPLLDRIVATPFAEDGATKATALRAATGGAIPDVWIGDTEVDIDAGKRVGALTVAVTCGLRTEAYLATRSPDVIASDLAAVRAHSLVMAALKPAD